METEKIKITNDGVFDIAIGGNRKETSWRNREILWSDFVKKVSITFRTPETLAEYMKAKKPRQDEIKDIGGFVGGYLEGGRRNKTSVIHRQMLTMDIDFADSDVWEDFTFMYGNAACLYSTHKHTTESPRLRLIIMLDRPVTRDEYVAIGRRVAGNIGVNKFDDTTYEPERLMYWPSTSKDGEFVFQYQDGPWLSADSVLKSYRNWHDSSEWPVSERQGEAIHREIRKQADPLEKPGVVGAFCRTYNIHEAIDKFLSDIYEPCAIDNRYTYKEGSTAAGLVVYDDKFAYSHHGTDPCSGKLCNAFDLVRIHLYGLRDENVADKTNITKYPSYMAMEEFASKDKGVKKLLVSERNSSAQTDFANIVEDYDSSWEEYLDCNKKGICESSRKNIRLIMDNDPNIAGCFAVDKFSNRKALLKLPSWRQSGDDYMFLRDDDEENLRTHFETNWEIDSKAKIADVLGIVSRANAFHPIKDYLDGISWDGEKRVDTVFIDYLGVEDTELNRLATRIVFTAAVARIYSPGCDFDYTLVLVGNQGVGKSKLLAKLAKNRAWFTDGFSVEGKEAYENLRGKWLVEIAELAGIKKADMDSVKKFLTKTSDFYRAAFDRYPQEQPRQCVFFGTTNNLNFLRDVTGDRRFWPMEVSADRIKKNQWKELVGEEINQIWAEAIQYYKSGLELYLPVELEAEMNMRRSEYTEVDERIGLIQLYLDTKLPANWAAMDINQRRNYLSGDPLSPQGVLMRDRVCISEIWCECLRMSKGDLTRYNVSEVMGLMRKIEGWEWSGTNTYKVSLYGRQKCFLRKVYKNEHAIDKSDTNNKTIF